MPVACLQLSLLVEAEARLADEELKDLLRHPVKDCFESELYQVNLRG